LGAVAGRSSVFGERVPGLPAPGKLVRPGGLALLSRSAGEAGKGVMIVTISILASTKLSLGLALGLVVQSQPGGIALFLPLILIMVIFYFLMILPAQRRQKKVTEMLTALKNGDKVITNGGIYGTIVGLEGDTVQLRIAEQVKMKVARNAIAGMQSEPPKES
jgi:preprotein translocase subunit YajC